MNLFKCHSKRRMVALATVSFFLTVSCQRGGHPSEAAKPQSPSRADQGQAPTQPKPSEEGEHVALPNMGIPYTLEEMEHYRNLKRQIWASPLGQLFRMYVSQQETTDQVLKLSNSITERVFSVPREDMIRIAALQIMVEDLYATGAMNSEISNRLIVLSGNINQKRVILNTGPIERLINEAPYFLFLGFLAGSPEMALQARGVLAAIRVSLKNVLTSGRLSAFFPFGHEALNLGRLFSPSFFSGYRPIRALHAFTNIYGPYSFAYIYLFRQRRLIGKNASSGKVLLTGIEELVGVGEL